MINNVLYLLIDFVLGLVAKQRSEDDVWAFDGAVNNEVLRILRHQQKARDSVTCTTIAAGFHLVLAYDPTFLFGGM